MTSPYTNRWLRKPYAHPTLEAAKSASKKAGIAVMMQVALWSGPAAMGVMIVAALVLR